MQSGGVSEAFRELANVLEALETGTEQGVEITTATPVEDELLDTDTVSVDIGVQVPFLEDALEDRTAETTLTPTEVHLEDTGSLRVDFQAAVAQSTTQSSQLDDDQPPETEQNSSNPNSNATRTPATNDRKHSEDAITSESAPAEETASEEESSSTESRRNQSQSADGTKTRQGSETTAQSDEDAPSEHSQQQSFPPYQDPERLQEVYDEHDTFAAMTEALDVDVTPQTVRRYMIEYDIHEPASTTGSRLAETLLEIDSESISLLDKTSDSDDTDSSGFSSPSAPTEKHHTESQTQNQLSEESSSTDTGSQNSETPSNAPRTDTDADIPSTEAPSDDSDHDEQEASSPDTPKDKDAKQDHPLSSEDPDDSSIDKEALEAAVETDLPSHLTLDDVIDVVQTARTLYDAQHQLDIDRERTRELLQKFNLLEFVHGRVAGRVTEQPSLEEIEKRIWNSVTAQTDPSADGPSPVHAHQ